MFGTRLDLASARLRLRELASDDADTLQPIFADPKVALTTASIPHPYPENGALAFIANVRQTAGAERNNLAITLANTDEIIGVIGFAAAGQEAELGYVLSPKHWGHGYAAEAVRTLVAYLFDQVGCLAVVATTMKSNPASESVLRKVGFHWEGDADVALPLRGGVFGTSVWRLGG